MLNTGSPIPEEDLEKIWVKFYKVDKARTRAYGGSGIGLSIVKAIMESMNQEYGVRKPGRRSGILVYFGREGVEIRRRRIEKYKRNTGRVCGSSHGKLARTV